METHVPDLYKHGYMAFSILQFLYHNRRVVAGKYLEESMRLHCCYPHVIAGNRDAGDAFVFGPSDLHRPAEALSYSPPPHQAGMLMPHILRQRREAFWTVNGLEDKGMFLPLKEEPPLDNHFKKTPKKQNPKTLDIVSLSAMPQDMCLHVHICEYRCIINNNNSGRVLDPVEVPSRGIISTQNYLYKSGER